MPPHPSPFPRAASASINKISTSRTLAASLGCCRPCFVCGSRPECQYHTRCRACLLGPSENGIQRWPNLILNFHPQRLLGGLYPGTASEEQCCSICYADSLCKASVYKSSVQTCYTKFRFVCPLAACLLRTDLARKVAHVPCVRAVVCSLSSPNKTAKGSTACTPAK